VALDPKDVPPQAWEYVPVLVVILPISVVMVWVHNRLTGGRERNVETG